MSDANMNVLVVIDVQNCFMFHSGGMDKGGTFLNAGEQASKDIVYELNALVQDKTHVVFSRDFHPINHISLEGYESRNIDPAKGIWPKHCRNKTLKCKSRIEGDAIETQDPAIDPVIANRVVDTTTGQIAEEGIEANDEQYLEVVGTQLSYMFFTSDTFREPVKQLVKGNSQGNNKIGLDDTTLESGAELKVIDKSDEQRQITYGEPITIEGKQYISLTKGERCDKEAYSAFNYHIQYKPATPYDPNNTLKVNIPPSKENSTGLWEWILTTARKEKKPNITITVCGLVGNVCVMHSLLQGIALWNNVYSKEYTDIAVKFVYSMQGTRFADVIPPMKINPNFVDDNVVEHFNKNIPRGMGPITITGDSAVEPKNGQIDSFEVLNKEGKINVCKISVAIPKIIMFSDIEGCQASPGKQSIFLCSKPFYDKIANMLNDDQNLDVAFLGDYFDQGMRVYDSIQGMNMLLDGFDGRVHVILGNRDVNKLRFCFELQYNVDVLDEKNSWYEWGNYYNGLGRDGKGFSSLRGIDLVKHTLKTSMGAGKEENGKMTGLYSFMPYDKIQTADDATALSYLKSALGIPLTREEPIPSLDIPPLNLLDFFKKCKIAHVFNGKVLLAHGGGFDSEAFFNENYIDSFENDVKEINRGSIYNKYSVILEQFRKKLSDSTVSTSATNVLDSVNAYNKLLQDVLSELTPEPKSEKISKFTWKFVLLQALGLKPDKFDAKYKSLIQSCSQDGCKGPTTVPASSTYNVTELQRTLKESGITHVSYGHKPICFPIPVIYRREDIPDIIFISNDTSNGNRKVEEVGENTAIGTMIIFDPNGVQSKIEPVQLGETREGKVDKYEDMYKPLTFEETPLYQEENGSYFLKYGNKRVVFNKDGHLQLAYVDSPVEQPIEQPAGQPAEQSVVKSGGKRRSLHKKQHKSKRGSKHRGSKRTRHNKHKHTKRGRKSRKY